MRAKIKQEIGDTPLDNEVGNLGSMKLASGDMGVNLSVTLLSTFIYISYFYLQIQYIDKINVSFCILQNLLKLTATNLNASIASAYKILPHPGKYSWCVLNNCLHGPHRGCSTEQ